MSAYDIGDRPTIKAEFVDQAGGPVDPSAITFTLKHPDESTDANDETDASNPAVGTWLWPIPTVFDADGNWFVRVEATAGIQTAEELTLRVQPSNFA